MYNSGLILEGGGMRGVYTAGILDFFMEKNMKFAACYGVSAGACHLCSYMSGQKGRAYRISTDYLDDKNYCSAESFLKTGDLFNVAMCYDDIPNKLDIFDYDAFLKYPGKGVAVVTDIETGRPGYVVLKDLRKDTIAVRASASLPIVSRNVEINGKYYLDGGIADSIPIKRAEKDGFEKNVVILTRPVGYRKKPSSQMGIVKAKYRKYPELVKDMELRHKRYNKTLDYVEAQEKIGNAFVFRPEPLVKIDRIEKDKNKLRTLYIMGYYDAATRYKELLDFLRK